ncbi:MAG: transposase [Flavobacteriales bacterium]|nr:transposase [Flavobacteriales bacterium]
MNKIKGKFYGDKGYIGQKLTELLFIDGLHLVTSIRNNMKNTLMELKDKILLRKRSVIETVNDELKNMCQIEHSRHRSFQGFISNTIAALIAYSFFPKKPSIKYQEVKSNQIVLF